MKKTINIKTLIFLTTSFLLLLLITLMESSSSYNDSDAFWHIKIGQWMIENGKIIDYAINTFSDDKLPYVAHEVGFQLIVGFLYNLAGWKGIYVFTTLCIALTIWGLYQLTEIARKEFHIEGKHLFLFIHIIFITVLIYFLFFNSRPQMISSPIILWFFIWLRRFQLDPNWNKIIIMTTLSLLLANLHGGVWLVIVVFYIMLLIESIFQKNITKKHIFGFISVSFIGILNFGGLEAITYILTIQHPMTFLINEWQPLNFRTNKILLINIIFFIWCVSTVLQKKNIFYPIFALGIFYLGISNLKQHLFLLLFLPYFFAIAIEKIKFLNVFKTFKEYNVKFIFILLCLGLSINIYLSFSTPYEQPIKKYPVQEMDYIEKDFKGESPKVLASYGVSGYLMFRDAKILADGRFDPYIFPEEDSLNGWSPVERSYYLMNSDYIIDIVNYDKPDYLILPKGHNRKKITDVDLYIKNAKKQLGKPDFIGEYGEVWKIKKVVK